MHPALTLLAASLADFSGIAEPKGEQPITLRANAGQIFAFAKRLQERGLVEQARRFYEILERDPEPGIRNLARYERALILLADGNRVEAATLLRRILDDDPRAGVARLRLATLLHQMGDSGAAQRELRALRSSALPPIAAQFADRLSAALQSRKPLGFQLEVAIAPDSNINRATASNMLSTVLGDFTIVGKAKSGVGAAFRGLAQARVQAGPLAHLVVRASGEANLYRDPSFDDIVGDLAVGPEFALGGTRVGVEAGVTSQWFGFRRYQSGLRLGTALTTPVDRVSEVRAEASWRQFENHINRLQDGRGLSGRIRYERALSPRLTASASLGVDRFHARDDAFSTRAWNASLSLFRDFDRTTVSTGVEFRGLAADDRLVLLPSARRDSLYRFHLGAVFRQLTVAGLAPFTRFVIERNSSNIEFYGYRRLRSEIGFSRAF